jgi:hypothetical protein
MGFEKRELPVILKEATVSKPSLPRIESGNPNIIQIDCCRSHVTSHRAGDIRGHKGTEYKAFEPEDVLVKRTTLDLTTIQEDSEKLSTLLRGRMSEHINLRLKERWHWNFQWANTNLPGLASILVALNYQRKKPQRSKQNRVPLKYPLQGDAFANDIRISPALWKVLTFT